METVDEHFMHAGGLELQSESVEYLAETRKWARFLSIVGFTFIAFMVLAGIGVSTTLSQMDAAELGAPFPIGWLGFIYIFMAAIYFFPVLYLYRFSDRMKVALETQDTVELTNAMRNLKSHYKFLGIMTIVMILTYIVGMAVFLAVGASAFSM